MSAALTLILTALTLSTIVSEVIRVDTNLYEVPSRSTRYFVQDYMTWQNAYKSCKDRGSHLVVINSQAEADDLTAIIRTETMFVGVHNKFIPGKYVTVTGDALEATGYNRWYPGAPNGGSDQCVGYIGYPNSASQELQGLWDIGCFANLRSICEEKLWSDYALIEPHNYYRFSRSTVTWKEAWKICRQEGAHLLIINSAAEITAVYQRFGGWGVTGWTWTGLHQAFAVGEFITVYNQKLATVGWEVWMNPAVVPYRIYVQVLSDIGYFAVEEVSRETYVCERDRIINNY